MYIYLSFLRPVVSPSAHIVSVCRCRCLTTWENGKHGKAPLKRWYVEILEEWIYQRAPVLNLAKNPPQEFHFLCQFNSPTKRKTLSLPDAWSFWAEDKLQSPARRRPSASSTLAHVRMDLHRKTHKSIETAQTVPPSGWVEAPRNLNTWNFKERRLWFGLYVSPATVKLFVLDI